MRFLESQLGIVNKEKPQSQMLLRLWFFCDMTAFLTLFPFPGSLLQLLNQPQ